MDKFQIKNDEYIDTDGFPHCKKCKSPRMARIDDNFIVRVLCKCEQQALEQESAKKSKQMLYEKQLRSGVRSKYLNAFFNNAQITGENKDNFSKLKSYVNNAQAMLKNNIGLLLTGTNSSGKTYAAACLCNELLAKGYSCCFTNLFSIIQDKFDKTSDHRIDLCDFLFLDDLGKEFIGREFDSSQAKFAERVLTEILDLRYSSAKPIILTSNFTLNELYNVLKLDKAITERLNESATRILTFKDANFRDQNQKQNSELAKKFGI